MDISSFLSSRVSVPSLPLPSSSSSSSLSLNERTAINVNRVLLSEARLKRSAKRVRARLAFRGKPFFSPPFSPDRVNALERERKTKVRAGVLERAGRGWVV